MTFPDQLPIPEEVLRIAEKLEAAGWETWCVGGAIRDNLLSQENKDFDLATAATPEQVTGLFGRTIPIGKEHGTIAVLDRNGETHEVTTFRRDVKTDGRHAVVEFGVSLDEDLARRDFTINAIAYHPLKHEWRDPFQGAQDLKDGVIRAVGNAWHRFREDYLRILRALRFAARFGFSIEQATWKAAKACVAGLQHLSAERVREEWFQGLRSARKPSELLRLWEKVGALRVWLPEVGSGERVAGSGIEGKREKGKGKSVAGRGERGTGNGLGDVIDRFDDQDPVLITSYLSRDPVEALTRLRCSRAEIERGRGIGVFRNDVPDPDSPVSVRRWMARAGDGVDDIVAISRAEGKGDDLEAAVAAVRESGAALSIPDLAIDGTDLKRSGFPEGPEMGRIMRELLDAVLEDPGLNTKPGLEAKAKQLFPFPASPSPDDKRSSQP